MGEPAGDCGGVGGHGGGHPSGHGHRQDQGTHEEDYPSPTHPRSDKKNMHIHKYIVYTLYPLLPPRATIYNVLYIHSLPT